VYHSVGGADAGVRWASDEVRRIVGWGAQFFPTVDVLTMQGRARGRHVKVNTYALCKNKTSSNCPNNDVQAIFLSFRGLLSLYFI
jgi:hypothetical protein